MTTANAGIDTNVVATIWWPTGISPLEVLTGAGFARVKANEVVHREQVKGQFSNEYLLVRDQGLRYLQTPTREYRSGWGNQLFVKGWGVELPNTSLSILKRADGDKTNPLMLTNEDLDAVYEPLERAGLTVYMVPGHKPVERTRTKAERLYFMFNDGQFARGSADLLAQYGLRR